MTEQHDRIEEDVAAWALGAADDGAESGRLAAHVASCPSCRELNARVRRAVGALPLAAEEVTPPSRLRSRILAEASRTPQEGREAAGRVVPLVAPARRRGFTVPHWGWQQAAVAAMVVALAGLGTWNLSLTQQLRTPAPVCTIRGTGEMAGVTGCVRYLPRENVTLVDLNGMPDAPPGKVYEMWLIPPGGSPRPAGVFVPAGGSQTVVLGRSLSGVHTLAVTLESGPSGSPVPTSQPQVTGTL